MMGSFAQLQQCYRQRVDQVLVNYFKSLNSPSTELVAAMQYAVLLGGKRVRPFLVYATGTMLGADIATLDAPAAAIECIHAYSLIHDDLPAMDDDDIRRGQPTCHIKFGEATAILAGDALQTLAFSILSETDRSIIAPADQLMMLSELARASGVNGMCAGQMLDLQAEKKQITLTELETVHQYKTGALIRSAVRLGALATGEKGKQLLPQLDLFSNCIGLAFQIQNDLLDIIGEPDKTGKRQGADFEHNKSTYPRLLGLESTQEKIKKLYQTANYSLKPLENRYDTTPLRMLAEFIINRES